MTIERMLVPACLLLVACGSSTPPADGATTEPTSPPALPTPKPKPAPAAAPTSEPDTGSFAAGPTLDVTGSTIRLNYQGGSYTLSESAIIATGKSFELRFQQPAAEGAHVLRLMPPEAKTGEPAKVEGKGALFLQLTDGKNTDGSYKLIDISSSCTPSGTITFNEITKPAKDSKGKGSSTSSGSGTIDVTIQCEGVAALREPLVIKGDFSSVPLKKK